MATRFFTLLDFVALGSLDVFECLKPYSNIIKSIQIFTHLPACEAAGT